MTTTAPPPSQDSVFWFSGFARNDHTEPMQALFQPHDYYPIGVAKHSGDGHWDVVLSGMVDGRMRLLATIPLDEWISLGATQYVLELHEERRAAYVPGSRPGGYDTQSLLCSVGVEPLFLRIGSAADGLEVGQVLHGPEVCDLLACRTRRASGAR
jgi:hypothetical protein